MRCAIHDEVLTSRRARVRYGLPRFPEGYHEAAARLFMHGGASPEGGCLVGEGPAFVTIDVCPRCEEARRAWLRDHEDVDRAGPR